MPDWEWTKCGKSEDHDPHSWKANGKEHYCDGKGKKLKS